VRLSSHESEPGHILVVDDNETNRDLLSRRLLRQGHTVEEAVDGRDALGKLAGGSFDLVLSDILMPEMDGYELLQRLKGDDRFRHLPVIMISALDDMESVIRGIEMGADDHLSKPFNPHILRARVTACLAKKRLHDRQQIYARSLEREMDIAREIQAGFLPDRLPAQEGWDFASRFEPARGVSGDFYDAFPLHGGRRIAIVVADVCGKGVGAALFMALFRSLVRALAERILTAGESPASQEVPRLVEAVNDYIARTHGQANMFATMFIAILDPRSGEVVYVNGGHEAAVLTGPGGVVARLAPTGPAVGMLPEMRFGAGHASIEHGQTLVLFTDGVTDCKDGEGRFFSEERLVALLADPADSACATLGRVQDAVRAHVGEAAPFDDISLFAARRAGR
jgi:phosphoserine phosphatase RsbU/P